ncbi:hypothetical protein GOBAR_DD36808 [Gossypium barbadense]|nr:hypothetical protein GOBAR_DD36808 [Gossypium barbadense]
MLGSSPQPAPWCPEQHRYPGSSNVREPRAPSVPRRSNVPEPRAPSAPKRSDVPEPRAPSAPWCLGCVGATSTIGNFGPCWCGSVGLKKGGSDSERAGVIQGIALAHRMPGSRCLPLPVRFPVVLRRSFLTRHPRIYEKDEPSPSPIPKLEFEYRYMDFNPTVLAFGIGVMINKYSRGHSYFIVRDTVLASTINDADLGSADVAFRTPPAPYEKSKSFGSGGSMVARLKLRGIDGRAPPGVEPAA